MVAILYKMHGSDKCIGYSDADWIDNPSDRKSTSGYIFMFSGGPISWSIKKQKCIALSTACKSQVAIYVALSGAIHPRLLVVETVVELGCPPEGPTLIFEDNISSYYCNG